MYELSKLGGRIKELRRKKGKTQEAVSEELGINIKTYRALEGGARIGKIDTLCLIAQYFETSLDYLVGGDEKLSTEIDRKIKYLPLEKQLLAQRLIESMLETLSNTK